MVPAQQQATPTACYLPHWPSVAFGFTCTCKQALGTGFGPPSTFSCLSYLRFRFACHHEEALWCTRICESHILSSSAIHGLHLRPLGSGFRSCKEEIVRGGYLGCSLDVKKTCSLGMPDLSSASPTRSSRYHSCACNQAKLGVINTL